MKSSDESDATRVSNEPSVFSKHGKPDTGLAPNRQGSTRFTAPGILLFIDQLLVAAGGWVYWLVITKLTSASEIGNATTFYSLVILVNAIIQLGLEYPLLKRSSSSLDRKFLGTVFMLEMLLTSASIPAVMYLASTIYGGSFQEYAWLSIGILALSSIGFVSRFALLGISDAKNVLLFDLVGTALKFAGGYLFVSSGYGGVGILCSFLVYNLVVTAGMLGVVKRKFTIELGSKKLASQVLKDALANMPSKLSKMFIMSLSVVLLASVGVSSNDVGIFYILLMISLAAGSFASSMAYMTIPASSAARSDLSPSSMRIGLTFTAPVVVAFMVEPEFVLSFIGEAYALAAGSFTVLSLGILPAAILNNIIAGMNILGKSKALAIVGSVQIAVFLAAFFALSPAYGSFGASLAIVLALACSTVLAMAWSSPRDYLRYIMVAGASILSGWLSALLVSIALPTLHPAGVIAISLFAAIAVLAGLKNTSVAEIRSLVVIGGKSQARINSIYANHENDQLRKIADNKRTSTYLLLGNYGNYNIGDEMLLRSVVTGIQENSAGPVRIFVPTRNPEFVGTYHKAYSGLIVPLSISNVGRLIRAFLKCNVMIVGGGGIWSGYTGPLAHLIPVITIAGKLLAKKVEFQAIGLYSTASALDRFLVNAALLAADRCSVRDEESYQILWKVNRSKARKVEDLAVQYIRKKIEDGTINSRMTEGHPPIRTFKKGNRIVIGISVKPVNRQEINVRIINAFATALGSLNSKYPGKLHFVFFPFAQTRSAIESDSELTQDIVDDLVGIENISVMEHGDPLEWFISIKRNVDLFIGMRFHSLIFASEAGKPILCIPYERKVIGFLESKKGDKDVSVIQLEELEAARIVKFVDDRVKQQEIERVR